MKIEDSVFKECVDKIKMLEERYIIFLLLYNMTFLLINSLVMRFISFNIKILIYNKENDKVLY